MGDERHAYAVERSKEVFRQRGSLDDLQKALLEVEEWAVGHPLKTDVPRRVCEKRCCSWGPIKGCSAHTWMNTHLKDFCSWRNEDIKRMAREVGK